MEKAKNIDEYISGFPEAIQKKLLEIRMIIGNAAPEASEKISWAMPTFYLNGNLVHFAAHKHHIGFYPGAAGIETFSEDIAGYKNSKGAVQFQFDKELPVELITKIVKFRVKQNMLKVVKNHKSS